MRSSEYPSSARTAQVCSPTAGVSPCTSGQPSTVTNGMPVVSTDSSVVLFCDSVRQRHLKTFALARPDPLQQRGRNAEGVGHARRAIDDAGANANRRPVKTADGRSVEGGA